jgi:hypothetical protein
MSASGWAAVWTLIVSVTATIIGSAAALVVKRRRDQLKARLDFVNSQLRYFYGPLLSCAIANETAWRVFKRQYSAGPGNFWDPDRPPNEEAKAAWLHWMNTLFVPNNLRMVDIISERADLLIEPGMPKCLADLCAHALAIKVRTKLPIWESAADYVPDTPGYPGADLMRYLERSFSAIKSEQVRLLKATAETASHSLVESAAPVELISDRWKNQKGIARAVESGALDEPQKGPPGELCP